MYERLEEFIAWTQVKMEGRPKDQTTILAGRKGGVKSPLAIPKRRR
jgi:hypothetical protein